MSFGKHLGLATADAIIMTATDSRKRKVKEAEENRKAQIAKDHATHISALAEGSFEKQHGYEVMGYDEQDNPVTRSILRENPKLKYTPLEMRKQKFAEDTQGEMIELSKEELALNTDKFWAGLEQFDEKMQHDKSQARILNTLKKNDQALDVAKLGHEKDKLTESKDQFSEGLHLKWQELWHKQEKDFSTKEMMNIDYLINEQDMDNASAISLVHGLTEAGMKAKATALGKGGKNSTPAMFATAFENLGLDKNKYLMEGTQLRTTVMERANRKAKEFGVDAATALAESINHYGVILEAKEKEGFWAGLVGKVFGDGDTATSSFEGQMQAKRGNTAPVVSDSQKPTGALDMAVIHDQAPASPSMLFDPEIPQVEPGPMPGGLSSSEVSSEMQAKIKRFTDAAAPGTSMQDIAELAGGTLDDVRKVFNFLSAFGTKEENVRKF